MVRASARVVSDAPLCASTASDGFASALTPTDAHFVRNHFGVPAVDVSVWKLRVRGAVARPFHLSISDLRERRSRTEVVTLECAGNGRTKMRPVPKGVPWDDRAVATASWTGAPLAPLLEEARPSARAVEVVFRGLDSGVEGGRTMAFERSLPIAEALRPEVLVAWSMNGGPMPAEHGAPARLVVPGWYAVASVKWLTDIEVVETPFEGWFQRDRYVYRDDGRPDVPLRRMRVKSLIVSPLSGDVVSAHRDVRIVGYAWSGEAPIVRVDMSSDGRTWRPADLEPASGPFAWRRFAWTWRAPFGGEHRIRARAVDEAGNEQPLESGSNVLGYGENAAATLALRAVG